MVNDSNSSTSVAAGERIDLISKFRNSIDVTRLISSIARLRQGQMRGPAPNGIETRPALLAVESREANQGNARL
jgi:hypothetical protein